MNCNKHNKVLLFICEQCNIKICSSCVSQEHKGHTFGELDSTAAQQSEVETVLKSIDQMGIKFSEQDATELAKKVIDILNKDYLPIIGFSLSNGIINNLIKVFYGMFEKSHLSKKQMVTDKFNNYHKQLDQLQAEINQMLDNQLLENKNTYQETTKFINESETNQEILQLLDNGMGKKEFSSLNEQCLYHKEFIEKSNQISTTFQKFISNQEKFHNQQLLLFDINLKFNDDLIKNQLVEHSKVEFKDANSEIYLALNSITKDPFFKEKQFKLNGGQKLMEAWDRVAFLQVPDLILPIAPHAKEVYFTDGYQGVFYEKFIPDSVTTIYLSKTVNPITKEALPKHLKEIYFCNGYSHDIPSNLISYPNQVKVFIGDIKYKLPNSFKLGDSRDITFHKYKSGPIPNEMCLLYGNSISLGELGYPIERVDSIYKKMKLIDGFNQILNSNQIPKIKSISFQANHQYPFEAHDLQSKYTLFEFKNNYNHPIVIKDLKNIVSLKIGSIKSTLSKESLSNTSITSLYFKNNFKQSIDHHLVPSTITELTLANIKCEPNLLELKSLRVLKLVNNFSFQNIFNTIPSNVQELCCGKLSFQVNSNMIPSFIKVITFDHFFDQDFQSLLQTLTNTSIETLKLGSLSKRFNKLVLSNPLPSYIKNLETLITNTSVINQGFISPNVKSLFIEEMLDGMYLPKSIPKTLKSIKTTSVYPEAIIALFPFTIPSMKLETIDKQSEYISIGKKFNY